MLAQWCCVPVTVAQVSGPIPPDDLGQSLIWFGVLIALIAGYGVLDAFELGAGMLLPLARRGAERAATVRAAGAAWRGHELWLVVAVGVVIGVFPEAWKALMATLGPLVIALAAAFVLRAACVQLRPRLVAAVPSAVVDWLLVLSSVAIAWMLGAVMGHLLQGVGLSAERASTGTVLVSWFPALCGLTTVAMVALHGSLFLSMRAPEHAASSARGVFGWCFGAFVLLLLAVIGAVLVSPTRRLHFIENASLWPLLWLLPMVVAATVANVPRAVHHGARWDAFLSAGAVVGSTLLLFAAAVFPNLVRSTLGPGYSVGVGAAGAEATVMSSGLALAAIAVPAVVGYVALVYWSLRGGRRRAANRPTPMGPGGGGPRDATLAA